MADYDIKQQNYSSRSLINDKSKQITKFIDTSRNSIAQRKQIDVIQAGGGMSKPIMDIELEEEPEIEPHVEIKGSEILIEIEGNTGYAEYQLLEEGGRKIMILKSILTTDLNKYYKNCGAYLLNQLAILAQAKGCQEIRAVLVAVKAIGFYKRFGFVTTGILQQSVLDAIPERQREYLEGKREQSGIPDLTLEETSLQWTVGVNTLIEATAGRRVEKIR